MTNKNMCDGCKLFGTMGVHSFTCPIRSQKIEISSLPQEEKKCKPHRTDLLGECYKCGETPDHSLSLPLESLREEKPMEQFYQLYLEGQRSGKAPQSYVDYFKAGTLWLNILTNAVEKARKEGMEEIADYMVNLKIGAGLTTDETDTEYEKGYYGGIKDITKQVLIHVALKENK